MGGINHQEWVVYDIAKPTLPKFSWRPQGYKRQTWPPGRVVKLPGPRWWRSGRRGESSGNLRWLLKMVHLYQGIYQWKWWFSIAMCSYEWRLPEGSREYQLFLNHFSLHIISYHNIIIAHVYWSGPPPIKITWTRLPRVKPSFRPSGAFTWGTHLGWEAVHALKVGLEELDGFEFSIIADWIPTISLKHFNAIWLSGSELSRKCKACGTFKWITILSSIFSCLLLKHPLRSYRLKWLVVSTHLNNIWLGWLCPIYGKITLMFQSPPTSYV